MELDLCEDDAGPLEALLPKRRAARKAATSPAKAASGGRRKVVSLDEIERLKQQA